MFVQQVMQLFVSQMISVLYAYNKIHYLQQKSPSKKLGYRRTYTNRHRFYRDCQDGICKNKIFKNNVSIAKDLNIDKYLSHIGLINAPNQIKHKYPVIHFIKCRDPTYMI